MADMSAQIEIAEFYKEKCVFITGATGFVGKVLVEKLLRSCPEVDTLYLLMRPKRGQDVKTRLDQLLKSQIFDVLRGEHPERLRKVEAVSGDITHAQLGLSDAEQRLLAQRVSIVFHSAATVNFDELLKLSVDMNIRGTQRILKLARTMTKLEALVHVSTAYSNCIREDIEEKIYPASVDYEEIIQAMDMLEEDAIQKITPKLIAPHPNTYTFTKSLAEQALVREGVGLPIAIIRPCIVIAGWREPVPGWVDNYNTTTGLIVAGGKGMLRSFICYQDMVADIVPVDVCINLMVAVAWNTAISRPTDLPIYNCISSTLNPITWKQFSVYLHEICLKYALEGAILYPRVTLTTSRLVNWLNIMCFQKAPAAVIDLVFRLTGRKPIMMQTQERLLKCVRAIEYFGIHEWKFSNGHVTRLANQMSARDRQEFNFDIQDLIWREYFEVYALGVRKYLLKEDLSTLPAARKHYNRLYWLEKSTQALGVVLLWRAVNFAINSISV